MLPTNPDAYRIADKILLLRLFRLSHVPSAAYGARMLRAAGLPTMAIEYGNEREETPYSDDPIPRERLASPWAADVPRPLRAAAIFFVTLARVAWRIVRDGGPRLIIAHGIQEQFMAFLLGRIFGVPYAVHVHEVYDDTERLSGFNRILFMMEGVGMRDARFLIFSEAGREKVYRGRYGYGCPTFVAANCPPRRDAKSPAVDLRAQHGLPADAKLMLYIGGIGDINAVEEAVAALTHAPNLHLLLVGWADPAYLERLRDLARECDVEGRVVFVGQVEDKWEYLDNCDLAYCVYRPTTLRTRSLATASNKFTEAMAAGLPVITTNNEDFRALVEGHGVGVCLDEITPTAIAMAAAEILAGRAEMARAARELHLRELHYEKQFAPVVRYLTGAVIPGRRS